MRRGLRSRVVFRSFRGRVMLLRRCMMFGCMMFGRMMFRSTMVFRGPVMLGSSMMPRGSMLVSVMLRGPVFRPFMFGFMRCLRLRSFARVAFVLPEFLGVVVHSVTLMSTLFLG